MYRAVLLDVYGTLMQDDDAYVMEVASLVAGLAGVSPAAVAAEWSSRIWAMADEAHGDNFRSLADLNVSSLAETATHFRVRVDAATVCRRQMEFWRSAPLFPDSLPFLAALDVPVCLVSDADRETLEAALAHHGISVAAVVTSADARAYKPRAEPFRMALRHLGLTAGDVIHVGDSAVSDVGGAGELGIATAFLSRDGRALPPSLTATHVIGTLTALPTDG
ncbi:HAD family hydrolase [Actinoplanes sp. TBRC 11911]|uniref:HAD family hydrolase n=1 Tax=Actinoplanes sp. TBRC 11911 TaxID=2729386 RepID=UPI00145CECEE|nr:HAD family hydrolase [Actinoplanes sp. TBRC 11911]NMO53002.1 HAD family hydrolase [Actinoplanes sp. TBRC 11911]